MPLFLSMLLTAGCALWYFKTAERKHLPGIQWAIAGAIAYQVPAWAWMFLVSRPYMGSLRATSERTGVSSFLIGHSWIVVGAVCAVLVYQFFLLRSKATA
ncbi:MAG: hypothetical protein FJ189_03705 [Gammaproteobacteria bacterium]|nr:hypothetical protein [Gammaproteobacteria bacterium]